MSNSNFDMIDLTNKSIPAPRLFPPTQPSELAPIASNIRRAPIDLGYDAMCDLAYQMKGESMLHQWKKLSALFKQMNPSAIQVPMHLVREAINAANSNFAQLRGSNTPVAFQSFQFIPSNAPHSGQAHSLSLTPSENESYVSISGTTRPPANPIKVVADTETASCGSALGILTANMASIKVINDNHDDRLVERLEHVITQTAKAVSVGNIKPADYASVSGAGTPVFLKASHYQLAYKLGTVHHSQICRNGYYNITRTICAAALCLGVAAETRPFDAIIPAFRYVLPTSSAFSSPIVPSDGRINIPISIIHPPAVDYALAAYKKAGSDRVWLDPEGTGKYVTISRRTEQMLHQDYSIAASPAISLGQTFAHQVRKALDVIKEESHETLPNAVLETIASQLTGLSEQVVKRIKDVPILMLAHMLDQFAITYPSDAVAMATEAAGSNIPLGAIFKRVLGDQFRSTWLNRLQSKFNTMTGPIKVVLTSAMVGLMHKAKHHVTESEFYTAIPIIMTRYAEKASPEGQAMLRELVISIGKSEYIAKFRDSTLAQWDPILYMHGITNTWSDLYPVLRWYERFQHLLVLQDEGESKEPDSDDEFSDQEDSIRANKLRDSQIMSWGVDDADMANKVNEHAIRYITQTYIRGRRTIRMPLEVFKGLTSCDNIVPVEPSDRKAFILGIKTNIHTRFQAYEQKQSVRVHQVDSLDLLPKEDLNLVHVDRTMAKYIKLWDSSEHGEPADVGFFLITTAGRVMKKKYKMGNITEVVVEAITRYSRAMLNPNAPMSNIPWYKSIIYEIADHFDAHILHHKKPGHTLFTGIFARLIDLIKYTYDDTSEKLVRVPSHDPYLAMPRVKDSIMGQMSKSLAQLAASDVIARDTSQLESYDFSERSIVDIDLPLAPTRPASPSTIYTGSHDPLFNQFYSATPNVPNDMHEAMILYHEWKLINYPEYMMLEEQEANLDQIEEEEDENQTIQM